MTQNKDFKKLNLHISIDLNDRLIALAEKEKLSVASLLRKAINEYLDKNGQSLKGNKNVK